MRILLAQYAALGVEQVRVEAIPGLDGSVNYTVLLEVFDVSQRPGELLLEMVRHEITDAAHVLPRSMQAVSGIFATTTRKLMFVLSVVVLTLMLTPADFEIEVSGQAFPKERRRIFAPDDGLVEELLVTSDERVSARQSILRLRNQERELELNRILGEVE